MKEEITVRQDEGRMHVYTCRPVEGISAIPPSGHLVLQRCSSPTSEQPNEPYFAENCINLPVYNPKGCQALQLHSDFFVRECQDCQGRVAEKEGSGARGWWRRAERFPVAGDG